MRAFTAAAVQVAPVPGPLTAESVAANLDKLVEVTRRCVEATGAELVVLPESATTGFTPGCPTEELWQARLGAARPRGRTAARRRGRARHPPRRRHLRARPVAPGRPQLLGARRPRGRGARRLPQDAPVLLGGGVRWWLGHPGDTVTVCDTALGRIGMIICFDGDYPELWPASRRWGGGGHLPAVGPAALRRHLGADVTGSRLRQPRLRHRGERRRAGPSGRPLLRQLAHRHPDRTHRRQGRDPRGLGVGTPGPCRGALVAHPGVEHHPGLRPPARPQPRPHPQPPCRPRGPGEDVVPHA